MAGNSTGEERVLTPWEVVLESFTSFSGIVPDARHFAAQHDLKEGDVRDVFGGKIVILSEDMCRALSRATGTSEGYFRRLNAEYERQTSA